ncbi:hypothetical protein GCM10027034_31300 [Ramlibacter solisilvae]|uniref:Transglutaminase-like domain-containing protein n=1 Tax=Ramlibacter tataouinensis TaxID=94132 RepID=A0A127JRV1_9BURK|nr:transglutaminase domain-containing protein [Ramlibacter tataouinensis]AMO22677.1 hypothetical protein UC35_07020 [Ramlibacter tataouinensis]
MLLTVENRSSGPWRALDEDKPERWLHDTPRLQLGHPKLRIQVMKLTQLRSTAQHMALACFHFVRALPFKTLPDPMGVTSIDVLTMRWGDSHTKGLLFIAMLRCLGIPARLRLVHLGPAFLNGLLDTGGRSVSHALSEVYLEGRWMRVDAYCVDVPLGLAARARLLREGRRMGFGVHMNGQVAWDGTADALGSFNVHDPTSVPVADLGPYDDTAQLAERGLCPRMHWADQASWSISTALLNRRIRLLRQSLWQTPPKALDEPLVH